MRAARLLHMLLLLQNRGRMTSADLAREMEVSRRTVLRDVDALTEAGLPIIVFQGNRGGIELGFNYRTRLTGLAADEAEAMGVILSMRHGVLDLLGLQAAALRAQAKLFEAFPDQVRNAMEAARDRFRLSTPSQDEDPRLSALARAVRESRIVRLQYGKAEARVIHPFALILDGDGWAVEDAQTGSLIRQIDWGRINISSKRFVSESMPAGHRS